MSLKNIKVLKPLVKIIIRTQFICNKILCFVASFLTKQPVFFQKKCTNSIFFVKKIINLLTKIT